MESFSLIIVKLFIRCAWFEMLYTNTIIRKLDPLCIYGGRRCLDARAVDLFLMNWVFDNIFIVFLCLLLIGNGLCYHIRIQYFKNY